MQHTWGLETSPQVGYKVGSGGERVGAPPRGPRLLETVLAGSAVRPCFFGGPADFRPSWTSALLSAGRGEFLPAAVVGDRSHTPAALAAAPLFGRQRSSALGLVVTLAGWAVSSWANRQPRRTPWRYEFRRSSSHFAQRRHDQSARCGARACRGAVLGWLRSGNLQGHPAADTRRRPAGDVRIDRPAPTSLSCRRPAHAREEHIRFQRSSHLGTRWERRCES